MKLKKSISLIMCFVILAATLYTGMTVFGDEIKYTGTVNVDPGSSLRVRKDPDADSAALGRLYRGDKVTIHGGEVSGINGDTLKWYKIEYSSGTDGFAYICSAYVSNISEIKPPVEYVPDASFEENLTKQGFPESYKVLLRQLHANHPSWVFLADHIGLTWDEVLAAESSVGKNLVQNTQKDSYKSMEYGAYNWGGAYYEVFDTPNWVAAYKDVVAYYLEPRNFINDDGIFQFLDQSYNETLQNAGGVNNIIKGSFMDKGFPEDTYSSYADLIMAAGKASGVSPYVLAAMIIQEVGWNGSDSVSGTFGGDLNGYYNFFNIQAYADNGWTAVQRGLMYARGDFATASVKEKYGLPWNTRAKSVIGGAIWYGSGYIAKGQDTLYYKKFDVIGPDYYNHQYMTNIQAANSEAKLMMEAYADIPADTALVFSIPVYKNMPDENRTALPTTSGANNYYLTDLSLDKASITPSFNMYQKTYETVVDYNVAKINVSATPVSGATVSGSGSHELKVGENVIKVTVTAASGKTSDYTIYVTRKAGQGEVIPDPEISSGKYSFGTYLTGVEPQTSVETLKSQITVKDGSLKVLNFAGNEKTSGSIVTGDKVVVYKKDGSGYVNKTIVIYGDANCDGTVNIIDLALIQKNILKISVVSGIGSIGADANKDNSINIIDLALVQKHILKIASIKQ